MQQINPKRLDYLFQAVQAGTLRAAADKLNLAPSALSRQIRLLEQELACTLIERSRRGVKATDAGELLLRYHRETLARQHDCVAELNALRGLQRGHVQLAVGEGFVSDLMTAPLPQFREQFPNLTLSITLGSSNEVIRLIEQDQAHIGLLFHPPNNPQLHPQVVSRQPICLICAPEHPLAQCPNLPTLEQLCHYPMALPEDYFGVRQLLAMAEFQQRIRFTPALTSNSIAVLKHYALSQMGITLLPAFVVARELAAGELVARELDHPLLQTGEAHMITRRGRQLADAPYQLLQHLTRWMRAFSNAERTDT